MQQYLKPQNPDGFNVQLLDLQRVATQLRTYETWNTPESLDFGSVQARVRGEGRTHYALDPVVIERQELAEFLHAQLTLALTQAIESELRAHLKRLQKSRAYASFANQWMPGLQLYYEQGLTLREIAPQLGMNSWDQARRILNPGQLLRQVRSYVISQLLKQTLDKAHHMGLPPRPAPPNYLKILAEQIEAFADAEIFQQAAKEIRIGQDRSMTSPYAIRLRQVLLRRVKCYDPRGDVTAS